MYKAYVRVDGFKIYVDQYFIDDGSVYKNKKN